MQINNISQDIRELAFEFLYWFSRLEFALKERGYLMDRKPGAKAKVDWQCFLGEWQDSYTLTEAGKKLLAAKPQRQVVGHNELEFRDVRFDDKPSDFGKVLRLVTTIRNNLFHGGKHGISDWDDPKRTRELLSLGKTVLDEIADHADISADYWRRY